MSWRLIFKNKNKNVFIWYLIGGEKKIFIYFLSFILLLYIYTSMKITRREWSDRSAFNRRFYRDEQSYIDFRKRFIANKCCGFSETLTMSCFCVSNIDHDTRLVLCSAWESVVRENFQTETSETVQTNAMDAILCLIAVFPFCLDISKSFCEHEIEQINKLYWVISGMLLDCSGATCQHKDLDSLIFDFHENQNNEDEYREHVFTDAMEWMVYILWERRNGSAHIISPHIKSVHSSNFINSEEIEDRGRCDNNPIFSLLTRGFPIAIKN